MTHPILYSFRRCPYAMRARLALLSSGQRVELREIALRDKPEAFLAASPSATVPCLVLPGKVIDESLEIMRWALSTADPERWLDMPPEGGALIARCDGPFKAALDRAKYASRYPGVDPLAQRDLAGAFLADLEEQMGEWLFKTPSLADFAILPFVRQFAFIDKPWFDAQPWPRLHEWLERFLASDRFARIMQKEPLWAPDDPPLWFPRPAS
jgi:glutathione S-transferase